MCVGKFDQLAWKSLSSIYEEASQDIDNVVSRTEKLVGLASTRAHTKELARFQEFLSLKSGAAEDAPLPYCYIPFSRNPRFHGRDFILGSIEKCLRPADRSSGFSSLVLHGLGGVGKTKIALSYAYAKLKTVDVVLWIPSENAMGLSQVFSEIAVNLVRYAGCQPHDHMKNRVILLDWLQKTG